MSDNGVEAATAATSSWNKVLSCFSPPRGCSAPAPLTSTWRWSPTLLARLQESVDGGFSSCGEKGSSVLCFKGAEDAAGVAEDRRMDQARSGQRWSSTTSLHPRSTELRART